MRLNCLIAVLFIVLLCACQSHCFPLVSLFQRLWNSLVQSARYVRRNFLIRPYDLRYNEQDIPEGPPYVQKQPGPLSFNLGPMRFRQTVYDFQRNQEPFVLHPGPLSFRIGPFRFLQIPTQTFTWDCCVNVHANCREFVNCEEGY